MSILKGNQLYSKNSILSLRKSSNKIDFNLAMNSVDLEEYNFINFLSSNQCKEYLKVYGYYKESLKSNCSFLDKEFEFDPYTNLNSTKNEKLKKLIYETSSTVFNDFQLLDLIKYKNKKDKGIQFYIKYDKKTNKGNVYLIDLYHMVIPTEYRRKGNVLKTTPQTHYNSIRKKVKNNVNLSEMMS